MRFRVYFEPIDIDPDSDYFGGNSPEDFVDYYKDCIEIAKSSMDSDFCGFFPDISRLVHIDSKGFPLQSSKNEEGGVYKIPSDKRGIPVNQFLEKWKNFYVPSNIQNRSYGTGTVLYIPYGSRND